MKKYYEGDTGGKYLVYARCIGYFADVQTVAQAEDAARLWWALTGDDGEVVIRLREKETVEKIMWREAEEGEI